MTADHSGTLESATSCATMTRRRKAPHARPNGPRGAAIRMSRRGLWPSLVLDVESGMLSFSPSLSCSKSCYTVGPPSPRVCAK